MDKHIEQAIEHLREEILKNKTVDDLDEKTLKAFFENSRVKFTLQQETEDYTDLSAHARLLLLSLAENGHLFKGTFLCLGKRNQIFSLLPSAAESKFIYFAGTKRTDEIRILEEVRGNLVQQYEKMLFVVERNIGRGRNRETNEDVPEIPLIALREFLANAYVHRAYLPDTQSFIQVEFYTDRLEINSPGSIPEQVDIHNVRQSVLVNPTVAMVFSLYQYIEKGGTGIAKAQSELERYGHLPAEIEQLAKPDTVRVRIWKKK